MSNETPSEPVETAQTAESQPTDPQLDAEVHDAVEPVDERKIRDASELTPEQLADIEAHSIPAVVRRAPKFKAFFWVGAIVGIVLGFILGMQSSSAGMTNRGVYLTVTVVFTTMIVCLIAGFIALQLDNRSAAKAEAQKKAIG